MCPGENYGKLWAQVRAPPRWLTLGRGAEDGRAL